MKTSRLLALSAFALFGLTACPTPTATCDSTTCSSGCCDNQGQCQTGIADTACGTGGQLCSQCFVGQSCTLGLCRNSGAGGGTGGGTGGGAGGGTGGGSTGPITCASGRTECSGTCVDLQSDERNCGICGKLCTSSEFCSGGACTPLPGNCGTAGCPQGFFCSGNVCRPGCAANSDCPQPGTCDTGQNRCTCLAGFHQCGSECVADNNVSACGSSCANCGGVSNAQAACTNNLCDFTCNSGYHRCGGTCAQNTDVATCGSSCTPCTPPAGGTATCNGTSCDFVCNTGFHRCGSQCLPNTSTNSCGSMCSPCTPPANGTATCNGVSCDFTCNTGYHRCGSQCVSNSSTSSCGSSCTACTPPANSTATCNGVSCGFSCNAGSHACGSACALNTSVSSCGTTSCTPCSPPLNATATCNGVACDFSCDFGYHRCGLNCRADDDVSACGSSCTVCPAGPANSTRVCTTGACDFVCNTGYHRCGSLCVADSSVTQCGASCVACPTDPNGSPVCMAGTCGLSCNAGYHPCGGVCVSNTSVDTCGTTSCTPCPNGPANSTRSCNGTACGFTCSGGFNACGGECVADNYVSACGAACTACTATGTFDRPTCSAGTCGTACITSCNAACVDVQRDPAHCGTCGNACGGGQACTGGQCRATCATGVAFQNTLPEIPVTTGGSGFRFLVEEMNGDGRADLIEWGASASIGVRYANADGTFAAPVTVSLAGAANRVLAVDVNADGRKDLVWSRASTTSTHVGVATNTGSGFNAPSTMGYSGYTPAGGLWVGDYNNDGRADVMVQMTSTYAFYFYQTSTGTWPTGYSNYSTNTLVNTPYSAWGDFNEDGRNDLVLATGSSYQVSIQTASSTWTPQTSVAVSGITQVRVADVNNDANQDLLVRGTSSVTIVLGNGNGSFQAATTFALGGSGDLEVVDLNGDTFLDLVSPGTGLVYVALATAPGTWGTPFTRLVNALPNTQVRVGVGQLLGSSAPELFSAPALTTMAVSALLNEGAGQFPELPRSGTVANVAAAVDGDFDGDGDRDVIVTPAISTGASGTGTVLLGNNTGTFGGTTTVTLRGDVLTSGRLNADVSDDLVVAIESTTVFGVDVIPAGTAGAFGTPVTLTTSSAVTRALVVDLNGDTLNDVLVSTAYTMEWFPGNGDGTFGARQSPLTGLSTIQAFTVGDLNLDGRPDLIINTNGQLRVYPGYGNGVFALSALGTAITTSATAHEVVAGDFDQDGRPDVVVGTGSGVVRIRGNGNGTLTLLGTISDPISRLRVTDLDNDRLLDLVTLRTTGELAILRGTGSFDFTSVSWWAPGRTLATPILVGQFNADTFRDVVVLAPQGTGSEVVSYLGLCR